MSFTITQAAPQELLPALRLLFPLTADRAYGSVARSAHDQIGVIVSRDATGRLRGAAMVQAIPGALGVAWPPQAESAAEADELVTAACRWLRERGVKVCQAFAATVELPAMASLERHGFRHVTQLLTMQRGTAVAEPGGAIAFEPVEPPFSDSFRHLLLSTHEGSLDCPELDGTRTSDELVAGYGELAHSRCFLARLGGSPVGVVFLTSADDPGALELAYMAVVPAARGHGIGDELLRFALAECARCGASTLTLSVDSRNRPALRLYHRSGFLETGRREVFLAHFSDH